MSRAKSMGVAAGSAVSVSVGCANAKSGANTNEAQRKAGRTWGYGQNTGWVSEQRKMIVSQSRSREPRSREVRAVGSDVRADRSEPCNRRETRPAVGPCRGGIKNIGPRGGWRLKRQRLDGFVPRLLDSSSPRPLSRFLDLSTLPRAGQRHRPTFLHAMIPLTTSPATPVRRTSRPWNLRFKRW